MLPFSSGALKKGVRRIVQEHAARSTQHGARYQGRARGWGACHVHESVEEAHDHRGVDDGLLLKLRVHRGHVSDVLGVDLQQESSANVPRLCDIRKSADIPKSVKDTYTPRVRTCTYLPTYQPTHHTAFCGFRLVGLLAGDKRQQQCCFQRQRACVRCHANNILAV